MMKKALALILVLAMALSVAACAAPAEPAGPESTPAESTPAESKPDEEAAEPYTITVNMPAGPGVEEGWKAVGEAYKKYHPEANVVVDLKAADGYAEWVKTIATDYKNTDVDLVGINQVDQRTDGMSINWEEYLPEVNPYDKEGRAWKDCFNSNTLGPGSGITYCDSISLDSIQVTWFYNKDIFAEVGVEVPETWDELVEVCEKLAAAGYQPLSAAGDYPSFDYGVMAWLAQIYGDQTQRANVEIWRAQEGDYCWDPDVDSKFEMDLTDPWNDDASKVTKNDLRFWAAVRDGVISANNPGNIAVWENFAKVFPKYAGGDAFFGTVDAMPAFYQGKAAMTLNTSGFAVAFADTMKRAAAGEEIKSGENVVDGVKQFELGMFTSPSMTNPSGKWGADEIFQAPARTIEVAVGFLGSFSRNAKHDAQVADFVMYYSSAEGQSVFAKAALENGWFPAGASLVYGVQYPEDIQSAFESVKWIGNCQKQFCAALTMGIPGSQESVREYYDLAQQCMTGKITAKEFAAKQAESHLKYYIDYLPSFISESDLDHPDLEPVGQDVK